MPGILTILSSHSPSSPTTLTGKAMECAGLLVEAVGCDVAGQDALKVLSYLLRSVEGDADATFDYALPACVRVAKCLRGDFVPYLPIVLGAIIAGAIQEIRFSMEDVQDGEEEEDEVDYDEESRTQSAVITLGGGVRKRVTLNTHAVQQKDKAARLIYELADTLRGHMADHLLGCFEAVLPLLFDKHSADIRSSASTAVAKLFEAYVHAAKLGKSPAFGRFLSLQGVFQVSIEKLLDCLRGEINETSRVSAAEALRDILQGCYLSGRENVDGTRSEFLCVVDVSLGERAVLDVLERCKESLQRLRKVETSMNQNEGLEAEDQAAVREEQEDEEDLLTALADALGHFLKLSEGALMTLFDSAVAPFFASMVQATQSKQIQVIGVCILDDLIEFGKHGADKYVPYAMPYFAAFLNSDHLVLRQSASYGIAQAAKCAPNAFAPFLPSVLPKLLSALEDLKAAGNDENVGAIENIEFALGVIHCNSVYQTCDWGGVAREWVAETWLDNLPLHADETEAKVSSEMFCNCLESMDSYVLGANLCNLPKLLKVCADVFVGSNDIDAESGDFALAYPSTLQRLVNFVRQIASSLPRESFSAAAASLSAPQQEALQKFCF